MKKIVSLVVCAFSLVVAPVFGQNLPGGLPRFNLKFAGGGPMELVQAIVAATGRPLNVIISKEDEDIQMPPLTMTGVTVPQLFAALEPMSLKTVAVITGTYNYGIGSPSQQYTQSTTSYGFKTTGEPTENSIWYFHVTRPSYPPLIAPRAGKSCQFYSLAPYLERGFTVDDITTAIQTGWKMAGESAPPELNYHKETRLIAFGAPDQLRTIEAVLKTLPSSNVTRNELDALQQEIKELRMKVDEIRSPQVPRVPQPAFRRPPGPPLGVPAEKTGK